MKKLEVKDIGNNLKGINLEYWGGLEGFLAATSISAGGSANVQRLRRVVPWLAKATTMTATAVADLPFEILDEKNKVVDSSSDWQNKIGGMDDYGNLFYKLASSLCLGRAYCGITTVGKTIVDLQYFAPHTIIPYINSGGLQYFDRASDIGVSAKYYPYDKKTEPVLLYFWLPDSDVEIGEAKTYPAGTALMAANLMFSIDGSLQTYADRGFVPATILSAKGMPAEGERQKAEAWWNRFLRGWTKEAAKIINAEAMSINKIGGGMEEMKGAYTELTKQSIENIGTAFGIPAALFMSDMAFASEVNPMIKVWYSTSQFKLIYQTIESTFTTQVLDRFGLKMKFRPETLDAFKDDQLDNAQTFQAYINSGIKKSIAARMAGLNLPDGVVPEDLDEKVEEKPEPVIVEKPVEKEVEKDDNKEEKQEPVSAKQIKELALWNQIAVRCFKKNKGKAIDFECKDLSVETSDAIRVKLRKAKSEDEINKAFNIGEPEDESEIKQVTKMLELNLQAIEK